MRQSRKKYFYVVNGHLFKLIKLFFLRLATVMQAVLLKVYTGDLDLKINAGFKF